MKRPLVVLAVGRTFGVTLTPAEAGSLLGLSDESVREQCRQHVIPTMPRQPLRGVSWRIPTCRLLLHLGISFDVVEDDGSLSLAAPHTDRAAPVERPPGGAVTGTPDPLAPGAARKFSPVGRSAPGVRPPDSDRPAGGSRVMRGAS